MNFSPRKIDRVYRIVQDFMIEINPEKSCKPCLFSLFQDVVTDDLNYSCNVPERLL